MLDSLTRFLRKNKKTILLIAFVSAITLLLDASVSIWLSRFYNLRLPSLGTIRVIGAEAYGGDINVTQDQKQYIDWGTVYPGLPVNRSFYIRSQSNVPIALNISILNLTFLNSKGENVTDKLPIKKPLSLTWNYSGTLLNPKQEIYVNLTIEASADPQFLKYLVDYDVQEFGFDIVIVAEEQ
ncbi:MAG: hypothetical protein QXK89_08050 [Candidatus Bathyarchaeia archaeon]